MGSAKVYTRREVDHLAALSRTYQESLPDIEAAIAQELKTRHSPEELTDIASRFGLTRQQLLHYLPKNVLRISRGKVHRAGLNGPKETLAAVRADLDNGTLKPGDKFPPRSVFVKKYRCSKAVHQQVVDDLADAGYIERPGGQGGPLLVVERA